MYVITVLRILHTLKEVRHLTENTWHLMMNHWYKVICLRWIRLYYFKDNLNLKYKIDQLTFFLGRHCLEILFQQGTCWVIWCLILYLCVSMLYCNRLVIFCISCGFLNILLKTNSLLCLVWEIFNQRMWAVNKLGFWLELKTKNPKLITDSIILIFKSDRDGMGVGFTTTSMWKSMSVICGRSVFSTVSSTNKTDGHNIAEILLKVALNTII